MQHLRIKLDIWQVRTFNGLPHIVIRSLIGLSLLIFATSAGNALEISVNLSTGGTLANKLVYGVTVDGSSNVTSWGSNYVDYVVKFQSNTGSTVNIDDFKVQLTANSGQNVGTNELNVTWFNWVDATSQTNPVWANRVGSLSVPSSSVSASFTTYLVGPGSFSPSPIPALSTGSSYFFRIWSQGGNSNAGYGLKVLADNIDLQYNVTSTSIDVYNYDGSTFSSTPASTFTPVPEPSTYLLCGLAAGVLVWSRRWRFLQGETVVGHS